MQFSANITRFNVDFWGVSSHWRPRKPLRPTFSCRNCGLIRSGMGWQETQNGRKGNKSLRISIMALVQTPISLEKPTREPYSLVAAIPLLKYGVREFRNEAAIVNQLAALLYSFIHNTILIRGELWIYFSSLPQVLIPLFSSKGS